MPEFFTLLEERLAELATNHRLVENSVHSIEHRRTLITHDSGFLALIRKEKVPHYGLVFFTQQVSIGKAIEEIEAIHLLYTAEELKNAIFFVPLVR